MMQIAKASIFSGVNNLYVNSVFDSGFDEFWGFTEDEVRALCADFGDASRFEEAKEWYDGYRFGNADVYNPCSLTALSYSSMRRTTLRPRSIVSIFARLHRDDSRVASSADLIHTS